MVPFYTICLNTIQLGTIDVIYTTVSLVVPVLALSIHHAVLRFTLDKSVEPAIVFTNGLLVTFGGCFVGLAIVPILYFFTGYKEYAWLIYFLFILQIVYSLISEFTRGLEEIRKYVIGNIIFVVSTALFNLLTLGFLRWGISGYILSSCLAYLIAILYLSFSICLKKYIIDLKTIRVNNDLFKSMIGFSSYLIPNSLFWWITNASDRYIILILLGTSFNGIYAVSNKIPAIITSVSQIFIQSWQLSAIKAFGSKDSDEYTDYIYKRLFSFSLLMTSAVLVILKAFMKIYVTEEYYISWQASTFLMLSATFSVMASFLGINYVVAKNNFKNMVSTLIGALVNIILNILLIPYYGITGAAFATLMSYFLVVIYRLIDTKKYVKIKAFNREILFSFIITILQIVILFITDSIVSVLNIFLFMVVLLVNRKYIIEIFKTISRLKIKRNN